MHLSKKRSLIFFWSKSIQNRKDVKKGHVNLASMTFLIPPIRWNMRSDGRK